MTDPALLRLERRAFAVGAVALVAAGIGGAFSPAAFFHAWLASWLFWLSIPLGALAIVMLHYLSGGSWGIVIRRVSESTAATLPLLALLFVPVAIGVRAIYEWAGPTVAADPALHFKHTYLNVPFFLARAVFYFVAWIVVARIFVRWSEQRDLVADPDPDPRRFRLFAGPGLVVYGITITFASIDWAMSIEPHWSSTVYPMMFAVGQVLTGFAFTITMAILLRDRQPFGRLINPPNLIDLGNLMLAFVLLWAYLAFSQFMLIYAANIREEVTWYLVRERPGWLAVALLLIGAHFALPFALLLQRAVKRNPVSLAGVAILILFMRLVDDYWLVLPGMRGAEGFHWLYVVTPLAVGGLWLAAFARRLRGLALVPGNDPLVEQAMAAHGH
ncbi:MAG: hypothetical protein E6J83_15885 [Deltaproteobacteria bacterium]|nr:MAG: hypothetical protein E6J83_15885 [Deltaproteobacteria bacterium]